MQLLENPTGELNARHCGLSNSFISMSITRGVLAQSPEPKALHKVFDNTVSVIQSELEFGNVGF